MGTLLNFQPSTHPARPVLTTAETGKLLLFTGVRYERMEEAEQRPDGGSQGKGTKRARRRS